MVEVEELKEQMRSLVSTYEEHRNTYRNSSYSEADARQEFINEFFEILGWDVGNRAHLPPHERRVRVEVAVEDEGSKKRPDYEFRDQMGRRKFFAEAKKPSVNLQALEVAIQTRRYGWNARLATSIATNFENLIVFDCTILPSDSDNAQTARLRTYHYTEYVDKLADLLEILSPVSIDDGTFDEIFKIPENVRASQLIDSVFLEHLGKWRRDIAESVVSNDPDISDDDLNYFVHRLLNRIVFLRICEDRDQEPYEQLKGLAPATYAGLKAIFDSADRRYNSHLFTFLEESEAEVDAEILRTLLEQLYYPHSPYDFSVVSSDLIASIYDLFITKTLSNDGGNIVEEEKDEIRFSQAVVATPPHIIDQIVAECVGKPIELLEGEALSNFSVGDICCGSGSFLLRSFEALCNRYLDIQLSQDPRADSLAFKTKREILSNHFFGIDIDIIAVEVTRFSLLLKLLEGETSESIDSFITRHHAQALPDLRDNVKVGNSLVSSDIVSQLNPDADELEDIIPINIRDAFPDVFHHGGFGAIVGNPPYVRIQHMVEYLPKAEMEYYEDGSTYSVSQEYNYDKYMVFVERALGLLRSEGILGYIVPQKFMVLKAGKKLRELISNGGHLKHLYHFGEHQVFSGRSTYTCIIILSKTYQNSFVVSVIRDYALWVRNLTAESMEKDADDVDARPWRFVNSRSQEIIDRLESGFAHALHDVADIFVGCQTSWDKGYILKNVEDQGSHLEFDDPSGGRSSIERECVRELFRTSNKKKPSVVPISEVKPNSWIIYPYKEDGTIISPDELENYPLAQSYFNRHRHKLESRDLHGDTSEPFYRYGRSQSLGKMEGEKIVVQVLSLEARYGIDSGDVVVTGGGNGPFYNIRLNENSSLNHEYLLAVLCHPVIEAFVRSRSSFFRAGYYSHGKQFIQDIPIVMDVEQETLDAITELVKRHIAAVRRLDSATNEATIEVAKREIIELRRSIFQIVNEIYGFAEEDVKIALEI